MPKDFMGGISGEISLTITVAEVHKRFLREGVAPAGNTPEECAAFIAVDQAQWARVAGAVCIELLE